PAVLRKNHAATDGSRKSVTGASIAAGLDGRAKGAGIPGRSHSRGERDDYPVGPASPTFIHLRIRRVQPLLGRLLDIGQTSLELGDRLPPPLHLEVVRGDDTGIKAAGVCRLGSDALP